MNEALQRWREDFAREPKTAFDRLVRGIVPLGGASQLSFGEILDALFELGDAALDTAAAAWLKGHILGPLPENTSLHRWASILEEYFRGIAAMELRLTGEILRRQHKRLRLWLHGFYEGPDRDPEGAYLFALARAQDRQHFSPLWRRLILGEELSGRPYLGVGILGFRKMPGQNGCESSGVPEGLLQALVELADKPGTGHARWKQTMRSLFATYRRNESYWVEHLAPLLPHYQQQSNAREWLAVILPGIIQWRPPIAETPFYLRRVQQVPVFVSRDWARRIRENPALCDTPEFLMFLNQHRAYAEATGDSDYINKTFNNLSTAIIRADRSRATFAVSLMEEALKWAPWNPRNWISYAMVLNAAHRKLEAINTLWTARHRFAWDQFIRTELGRVLLENGDLTTSEAVLREAAANFPSDVVCRNCLGETLRAMQRFDDALAVFEQACRDFPNDPVCRIELAVTLRQMNRLADARSIYEQACRDFPTNQIVRAALGDLLIDMDEVDQAESKFREALEIDSRNPAARGGVARVLSIRSARNRDHGLRDEAKRILQEAANEGDSDARNRLEFYDEQWNKATTDSSAKFRRETVELQPQASRSHQEREIEEMGIAERLGRAMVLLWQAERAEDRTRRFAHCSRAMALLDVPQDAIEDELIPAFVETHGLVLLASGDAEKALAYFEEQIRHYGRGGWVGIQLGDGRARIALGLPKDSDDSVEAPSSQSTRFALFVARVIQALTRAPQESEVRDLLKTLYPGAAELARRAQPLIERGESIESGAEMLGAFLQTRWFHPAGIQSADDFDQPDRLHAVLERINVSRIDTFDVLSNSTLAIAA